MRFKKSRWFAVAIWMVVIFAFSHQAYSGRESEKYLGDINVPVRKAGHIGEYMILFLLVRWALSQSDGDQARANSNGDTDTACGELVKHGKSLPLKIVSSPAVLAFIISMLYAGSDEWHQSYVPGRSATVTDVAVDTLGISIGAVLLLGVRGLRRKPGSDRVKSP